MTGGLNTLLKQIVDHLYQRVPALYRCIDEHCYMGIEAMEIFIKYLHDGNEDNLAKIETINKHRNEVNSRVYNILNRESAVPADIRAIYRAFFSLDMMINHIKIATKEISVQQLNPDEYMLHMARSLKVGVNSLQRGFNNLTNNPTHAQGGAQAARSAANDTKNVFALAIVDISPPQESSKSLTSYKEGINDKITTAAITTLKRRMIYNHLSNTADRVTWASNQLYDLSLKYY